jgi:hypothetical protein
VEHILQDGPFDLIVASDVVWVEHLVQPLASTLASLMGLGQGNHTNVDQRSRKAEIILAQETRSLRVEQKFFQLMSEHGFHVQPVDLKDMHPDYRAKDISIFRLKLNHS